MVNDNSVWIIGSGTDINLWTDNWMGTPLATRLNVSSHMFPALDANLASVIIAGKWKIPPLLFDVPLLAATILNITLPVTPLDDRHVWKHASDGVLTSKLAHQFWLPPLVKHDWAQAIWRICILPSHSFIFWRLMLSRLPTDDNLQVCGCTLVSVCVLCYKQAETSTHLFLHCDFAVSLWMWIGAQLHVSFLLLFVASLLDYLQQRRSSQMQDVVTSAIVHTVHAIWLARNSIRFSSDKVSTHATMSKISAMVALSGTYSKGNCLSYDVMILNNFLIPSSHRRVKEIITVVWKPPTINWIKANTDGSVLNSISSCGGIFRDYRGTFLGAFASKIGAWSVYEAEIMGLIIAMEYAAHHKWTPLWLETDSTSAVNAFKNPSIIPLRLRNRWHNCTHNGLMVICSHIYREGNCCADTMAVMGHELDATTWYHVMPASLSVDFARDRHGLPNFRFL